MEKLKAEIIAELNFVPWLVENWFFVTNHAVRFFFQCYDLLQFFSISTELLDQSIVVEIHDIILGKSAKLILFFVENKLFNHGVASTLGTNFAVVVFANENIFVKSGFEII